MSTRLHPNANSPGKTTSATWLRRLGVFVFVAGGLSIVGILAVKQTHRRPPTTNSLHSVCATIEASNPSGQTSSFDAWRAEILSPLNLHAAIADLHLDQELLPGNEQSGSPSQWEARVQELLQVEEVRDRRHSDKIIRITFPVGRNASEAVALVNGLAQRAVAGREDVARKAAELADQLLLAKRTSTTRVAQNLQQLQTKLANVNKLPAPEKTSDKNSVTVDAFFAERHAQLSLDMAEYKRRREVLLETLLPAHPEVRALDLKIENVQAAIAQIPLSKNPTDTISQPSGADSSPSANEGKLLADISNILSDLQKLTSEQAAVEQQWQSTRTLPSYVVTLAQVPVVSAAGDKPSTAMLSFVVLAAVAVGIAAAGWVRNEPVVLRTAREIEKSLHLKVLAVLPSAGVKI